MLIALQDYEVKQELYEMKNAERVSIMTKDAAWVIGRLNLSDLKNGKLEPISSEQIMPSWAAFNSALQVHAGTL